jgi:spermidine synthase
MRQSRNTSAQTIAPASPIAVPDPLVLALFFGALFMSALLLFIVQPMFAKMVLPTLGGSPAVWSVAMCFFQATLLGGYAYAHGLYRYAGLRLGIAVHLGLLGLATLALPLELAEGWHGPAGDNIHFWVLALFAASIGLPFFAISGNAPLLQAWFSKTGHAHAKDPYFLYGASNMGSLLALLCYPILVEPNFTLSAQSWGWSAAFVAMIALVGLCGIVAMMRGLSHVGEGPALAAGPIAAVCWRDRLAWTGLAFVPSGLLVAVTSHITTDVAAAPFLWVVPLALFLLTFIITFQLKPILSRELMLAVQPAAVAAMVVSLQLPLGDYWPVLIAIHLVGFFVCAMVCHGELVRRRPQAGALTEFYLWMSFGGALGGLFTGLIAPQIFSSVIEYPLMIVLALLARPHVWPLNGRNAGLAAALFAAIVVLAAGPKLFAGVEFVETAPQLYIVIFIGLAVAMILARSQPYRLMALVLATLVTGHVLTPELAKGDNYRGFFGVNKVINTPDGAFRLLQHGTTLHGAIRTSEVRAGQKPEPLTYYHQAGPFADAIAAKRRMGRVESVGVVGLGTGSLACYARPGEKWRFYEIDPIVIDLARDPQLFTFLSRCAPQADIVQGDARLKLQGDPDGRFDLLVIDAFSSDAIPVHLITREAVQLYLRKLKSNGLVAFHISNRNMKLSPVLAALAQDLGLSSLMRYGGKTASLRDTYKTPAHVVVIARSQKDLRALAAMPEWRRLAISDWRVWTDDYSNVLAAMLAGMREKVKSNGSVGASDQ